MEIGITAWRGCTCCQAAADREEELLAAAAYHAAQVHQHTDSPQLRTELRKLVKTA